MLMQAEPVYQCYEAVKKKIETKALLSNPGTRKNPRVIYLSPQGKTFNQTMAEEFAQEEDLVFLCGHYEGIDERVLNEVVTDYVSIGDYVLTGGELPAMIMIDAISRLVPGPGVSGSGVSRSGAGIPSSCGRSDSSPVSAGAG